MYDNNMAMNQPTQQIATAPTYTGGLAVDEQWTVRLQQDPYCFQTLSSINAYWTVDLGSNQTVVEVWITSAYVVPSE